MRPKSSILAWSLALATLGAIGSAPALLQTTMSTPARAAEMETHTFRQGEKPVRGSVTVRRDGNRTLLVFSGDFRTSESAPDLKVAVSPSSTPLAGSKPPAYPLKAGTYMVLSPLKSASGAQTYVVPASVDLSRQGSVLIWCEQFNATMAWAPLHG